MAQLDEIAKRLANLPADTKQQLAELVADALGGRVWTPNPGAQAMAYDSGADVIGFGGEAGPGKTALLIGLAITGHKRSLVLRRTKSEARGLTESFAAVIGHRRGLNANDGLWRLPGDQLIRYGGCEHENDKQKYKGEPWDFMGFDEVVDFTRSQVEFIMQWNRTTDINQRCRTVMTFNPPSHPTGLWVIEYFGPWLDPAHPRPAKSGEIRWFTSIDGRDTEMDGRGPHVIPGEEKPVYAKSRTFIRGHLDENPVLARTGYDATRSASTGKLRDLYKHGSFEAALADVPGQLITTAIVRAAQARWTPTPPPGVPMCAIGVDCSGGGPDPMIIATRYDGYYPMLVEVPGSQLPPERAGAMAAGVVVSYRRDNAIVVVDLGGGYGGPLYERLSENGIEVKGYKGAEATAKRTRDRKLGFYNVRSAAYWLFKEALDPDQPGGSPIILPNDPLLLADLTAVTFQVGSRGIQLEEKTELVKRLGRSPDRGDAVVMAWWEGLSYVIPDLSDVGQRRGKRDRLPEVHIGYPHRHRR